MTDWIKHTGNVCPVPPDTKVRVRFRNGKVSHQPDQADRWNWAVGTGDYIIVAYQIVDQPQASGATGSTSGWIEWNGGERPVPPGTMVEVKLRDGSVSRSENWNWGHAPCPGRYDPKLDIVAYRALGLGPSPNDHYRQGDIECIDAIRAALTDDEWRGYCKGNVLKYVWREKHKGGDLSLIKAEDYLRWAMAGKAEGKR